MMNTDDSTEDVGGLIENTEQSKHCTQHAYQTFVENILKNASIEVEQTRIFTAWRLSRTMIASRQ